MKRVLLVLLALALLMITGSAGLKLQAAPLNQAAQTQAQPWGVGALLRVKASVAFSWLRSVPSVNGAVVDTAPRGDYLVVVGATPTWDGVQWWWQIRRGSVLGWVEENSLELVLAAPATTPAGTAAPTAVVPTVTPKTPSAPATWAIGATLHLKAGVPFSWLRSAPSPSAAVVDTAKPADTLTVISTPPQADNLQQLWWLVRRSNGTAIGYVEQDSLEPFVPTPTAVPSSTPTAVAPAATKTPSTPATWAVGAQVRVKTAVAFVWLRLTPSSDGKVVDTAVRGENLVVASASPITDSVQQLWWLVRRSGGTTIGYVEQDSLEAVAALPTTTPQGTAQPTQEGGTAQPTVAATTPAPGSTPAPAAWAVGSIRSVKAGLKFAWIRTAPSPNGGVQLTLYPGWLVLVQNATPTWDGVQWWWQVWAPSRNIIGWVEQNSLN